MATSSSTRPIRQLSPRAAAATASLRRAWPASLGVALVVAADAIPRSLGSVAPPVFVAYSVLIWAVAPIIATVVIIGVAGHARSVPLPWWGSPTVAGLVTAAWVSWGASVGIRGLAYGLLLGLGAAGAALALGSQRRLSIRVAVAAAIAVTTALVLHVAVR